MICYICAKKLDREKYTMNPDRSIEFEFEAAYGSYFDGDRGVIYICDDCYEDRIDRVFGLYSPSNVYEEKPWNQQI